MNPNPSMTYQTFSSSLHRFLLIPLPSHWQKRRFPEDTTPYVELEPMDFDNPPTSSSQAAMARSLHPHKGVDYKIRDWLELVLPITGFSNASSPTFKGKLTVDSFDESMDYSRQKFFLNHKKFPDHIDPLSRVGYLFTRLVICRHNPANIHVSEVVNYKHSSPIISMLSASFGFNFRLNFSPIISQELTILQTIEMEAAYNYVNSDYSLLTKIHAVTSV
ncbi:hypothetical protein C1645_839041 [Glomus cerebriforme]|uniref:Uncharacterized protein n=1 Tax=Glomus cerebriforme TaxID=658196 RepID=A0A397SBZ6_9GLOM|nr:hypothetical protein C1645_839041 [Glomus cerebriforme]